MSEGKTLTQLIQAVVEWGHERGLHEGTDLQPQFVKLTEELGELAAGVARKDEARIIDAVGDMLVVLINFGAVFANHVYEEGNDRDDLKLNFLLYCLGVAWEQIKHRHGRTEDGVFIKEDT